MARANEHTNYLAFNVVRAIDGKNPFTFRHGLSDLAPGAWATAKQWMTIGHKVRKGETSSKVYSVDENTGKVSAYCVFHINQVRRTREGMKADKLAEIVAATAVKGFEKAEIAARKCGVLDAGEIAETYKAVCDLYREQAPDRERAKNDRIAAAILVRETEKAAEKPEAPETESGFVDTDAAEGGELPIE